MKLPAYASAAENAVGDPPALPSKTVTTTGNGPLDAERPSLWTAWLDYSATGEGRAYMACIAYAKSDAEIIEYFGKKFDPWYAKGCDVGQGVVRNRVTTLLWSSTMLDHLELAADEGAWVEAHSWMHFNMMSL